MPIVCKECGEQFHSMITAGHLKKHGMSTNEYKVKHSVDSLWSDEARLARSEMRKGEKNPNYGNNWDHNQKQNQSEKLKGRVPWNKNIKLQNTDTFLKAAAQREAKYQSGELIRKNTAHSVETKNKISHGVKSYAKNNPAKIKNRAKKAVQTKKNSNFDFGSAFRGKTHTAAAKSKISISSKKANYEKSVLANQRIIDRAMSASLQIHNIDENFLQITCKICGSEFEKTKQYFHQAKFVNTMCPVCFPTNKNSSQIEKEILQYITSIHSGPVLSNDRTTIKPRELDIYLPDKKIGIEVNGVFWHSELVLISNNCHKHKDYQKFLQCRENNIQLITIYDIEWITKPSIVMSRLNSLLSKNTIKIGARKTDIREIASKQATEFFNQNHLQGAGKASVRLGLFHNDELVAGMTFSKSNRARSQTGWEIDRFAVKQNHNVQGAAQKLFSYFIKKIDPDHVVSFSDNRWSEGKIYETLGFEQVHGGAPNYWYFRPNDHKLYHRFGLRKNQNDDQHLTEWQNRVNQGWNRIWDCGHSKWVWQKKEPG